MKIENGCLLPAHLDHRGVRAVKRICCYCRHTVYMSICLDLFLDVVFGTPSGEV